MANQDVGKGAKQERTRRVFVNKDGSESARASENTVSMRLEFIRGGKVLDMNLVALNEVAAGVIWAGSAFGIMTSVANAAGSHKDDDEAGFEAAETRWLTMIEDRRWTAERDTGPRIGDLLEALARVQEKRTGTRPDDGWKSAMREKVEAAPEAYRTNERVKAELDAIKLERMVARAKESAAKAADGDQELNSILDSV